jgi:hypothetical protein
MSQEQSSQGDEITLLESFQLAPEEALRPKRHQPRQARSRGKAALRVASILLLVLGLAVMVLLVARLSPSAPLVNASVTVTAATHSTPTPTATTRPTKTADPNTRYAATIPGPCDASSGAHWTAVGTYQCLTRALLLTRRQGNNDAGVYFSGSASSGAALPLNYDFQVNASHLQGNICVMISSAFSSDSAPGSPTGASQVGSIEVDLCANQTLLVYRIPPPNANSPLAPIYAAAIAPAASYTIAVSCAMPSCAISVNNRHIASAPYDKITQMSTIGFTILGNDSAKIAAGSAEFDHFLFTPAV